ncbi:hypothetical protein MNBD_GAMMA02-618, partial [hydrothermal vent metagenome]
MKIQSMLLILISSTTLAAQITDSESSSAESIGAQAKIVVSENLPNIPAPLQAEAKRINAW